MGLVSELTSSLRLEPSIFSMHRPAEPPEEKPPATGSGQSGSSNTSPTGQSKA